MDWIGDNMWATWLLIAVALVVLELLSTALVLAMLAGGALSGMVTAFITDNVVIQILVAVAVSLAFLIFLRPGIIKRLHAGPELAIGAAALVGRRAFVLEPLSHVAPGRIKIGGDVWTAQPLDEEDLIDTGVFVDVVTIKGATAYVVRAQQPGAGTVPEMEG